MPGPGEYQGARYIYAAVINGSSVQKLLNTLLCPLQAAESQWIATFKASLGRAVVSVHGSTYSHKETQSSML